MSAGGGLVALLPCALFLGQFHNRVGFDIRPGEILNLRAPHCTKAGLALTKADVNPLNEKLAD